MTAGAGTKAKLKFEGNVHCLEVTCSGVMQVYGTEEGMRTDVVLETGNHIRGALGYEIEEELRTQRAQIHETTTVQIRKTVI